MIAEQKGAFVKYHDRIVELNPKLNAFVTVVDEPGQGIPYALKDVIMYEGVRCTAGSKILENYTASYDATVVKRLKNAGMSLLGKTVLDEFALGSSTETSASGPAKNPWDVNRVPGGSSGGSAVAVAAGMAPFALGSDTGGSIRQPASFCGVVGLKPTYGRVSRYGLIAMASSLDQIGTFTNSVEDAAYVMNIIGGHDPLDATSRPEPQPDYAAARKHDAKFTYGVPDEYFGEGVDPKVSALVEEAVQKLEAAGHKTKKISMPHSKYALATYYLIMPVEVASNLSRYDGVKYGLSREGDVTKTRSLGFGEEAKRRIMLGTYASSSGYYDAYYLKAQKVRSLVLKDFEDAFSEVDLIVTPTTPEVAFKFGARSADPVSMYMSDVLTVPANISGVPAISVPCGLADGLPVGLQFMAPHFAEDKLLAAAHQYEKLRGEFPEPEVV